MPVHYSLYIIKIIHYKLDYRGLQKYEIQDV